MCFSPAPLIGAGGCLVQIAAALHGGVSVEITWGPGARRAHLITCGAQICSARHLLAPASHCHVVILPVTKPPIGKEPRTQAFAMKKKSLISALFIGNAFVEAFSSVSEKLGIALIGNA